MTAAKTEQLVAMTQVYHVTMAQKNNETNQPNMCF